MRFLILVLVLLGKVHGALAEETLLRGPRIERQKTPVWCWASSIQNVLAHHGVKVTQEQVVRATWGRVHALPSPNPTTDVFNLLKASAMVAPSGRVVHPFLAPPLPDKILIDEIRRERCPLVAWHRITGSMMHHVVVITGIETQIRNGQDTVVSVTVNEPALGCVKTYPIAEWRSLWASTILVRVAPVPPRFIVARGARLAVDPSFSLRAANGAAVGRVWYQPSDQRWHYYDLNGQHMGRSRSYAPPSPFDGEDLEEKLRLLTSQYAMEAFVTIRGSKLGTAVDESYYKCTVSLPGASTTQIRVPSVPGVVPVTGSPKSDPG